MAEANEVKLAEAGPAADAPEPTFTVDGNRLTLLPSGRSRLDALLALIDGARHSLRLLYYMWCDDAAGQAVREATARAVARGVAVRLIVDGFGSDLPADYFAELKGDGADVCRFLPRYGRRYLLRNHQKLALADGETEHSRVIVGGFNIQARLFRRRWPGLARSRPVGRGTRRPSVWLTGYFDALSATGHTARQAPSCATFCAHGSEVEPASRGAG